MSKLRLDRETLRVLEAPDIQGGTVVQPTVLTCACPVITAACPFRTILLTGKTSPDPWQGGGVLG